jgi:cell division protein DivIC
MARIPRWFVSSLVLVLLVAVTYAFGSSFLQVYRLRREAARLEQVRQDLIEQGALLREEIKLLHTPGYIERIAREQLGLVKPGEVALLIIRPKPPTPRSAGPRPAGLPAGKPTQKEPVWRSWLHRLGF